MLQLDSELHARRRDGLHPAGFLDVPEGLCEGPVLQSRRVRPPRVDLEESFERARRDPHREIGEGLHAARQQPLRRDPRHPQLAARHLPARVEQVAPGLRLPRPGRIERPGRPLLDHPEDPFREVTRIEDLQGAPLVPRREDLAVLSCTQRPVGQAPGEISRPAEHPRSHDERSPRVVALDHLLAQHLQRAVVRALPHLAGGIVGSPDRTVLSRAGRRLNIHRDGGDEDIEPGATRQQRRRGAHHARHVSRRVDHRVPPAFRQRLELPVAIPAQVSRRRERPRIVRAAIEESDRVTLREGRLHQMPPHEHCPAQYQ